ncbi:hypothetical protein [Rosenbergiella nectarea]|uniref:hypothetical protein n=1 Tax=Rosenbergiella nectarea TaxID=988801 RepID=UPI001BD9B58E|nr:hypothetical protein [Rosenbergiella nectarea]MBT0729552.1 hypothetical protein [Rosenbergiella nectarea subsp. apis]
MNIQDVRELKQIIETLRSGSNELENELIKQRIDEVIDPIKSNPIFELLIKLNETDNTKRAIQYLVDYDMDAQEKGTESLYDLVESRVIAERAFEIYDHRKDYRGAA